MWSWKKCSLVSLGVGLFTAVMMSVFWYIWSIHAPVPELSTIKLSLGNVLTLPFHISRWSDVIFAPLLVAMMLTCYGRIRWTDESWSGLAAGLAIGLIYGLAAGFYAGLAAGLAIGLFAGLGFGLGFGVVFGVIVGLGYVFGFFLGFGVINGLVVGVVVGLIYGLVFLVSRAKPFFAYITGSKQS